MQGSDEAAPVAIGQTGKDGIDSAGLLGVAAGLPRQRSGAHAAVAVREGAGVAAAVVTAVGVAAGGGCSGRGPLGAELCEAPADDRRLLCVG